MPHAQVSSPVSPCVGDIPSCSSIISPNPYDVLSDENPNSIHENVTNNETQPPLTENNEKKVIQIQVLMQSMTRSWISSKGLQRKIHHPNGL